MKLAASIIVMIMGLDQLTKWWVVSNFQPFERLTLLPGLLFITRRFNTGAAWSLFEGQLAFLIIVTIVAVGLFAVYLHHAIQKNHRWQQLGMSLMIGGALGNFIDRVRFGGVIDFIDVWIINYDFPVFNVADSALTMGVIVFMIGVVWDEQRDRSSE
jgi:signal peptidase II